MSLTAPWRRGTRRSELVAVHKVRLASVVAVMVAVPTVSACGSDHGSSPCSSPNQRQLQARISSVETRAHVTSLSASGPSCGSYDAPTLTAARTYPSAAGIEAAIESALTEGGWTSTPAADGEPYTAQIRDGRFTTYVELSARDNDEPTGSVLQARYYFRKR
jgi:hypothetical protein